MSSHFNRVKSSNVTYSNEYITAKYNYDHVDVDNDGSIYPKQDKLIFQTQISIPKTGVMIVGLGGNNGSTLVASLLANKHNISWNTKDGIQKPNYIGSLTQSSVVKLGVNSLGQSVFIPFKNMLPMIDPSNIILSGYNHLCKISLVCDHISELLFQAGIYRKHH
jgi:myo-inositol-1-phosphate synthase